MFKSVSKAKEKKRHRKRKHGVSPGSRNSSVLRNVSESPEPHSSTFLAEPQRIDGVDQNNWHLRGSCLEDPTRPALSDVTTALSNSSPSGSVERQLAQLYKPRPRCLSRYIQRHKTVRLPVSDSRPRWVKNLLNDDIHTGRNLGVKLSFMHTGEAYDNQEERNDGKLLTSICQCLTMSISSCTYPLRLFLLFSQLYWYTGIAL